MKYYYHEHLRGYAEMAARGLKSWGEVHGDPRDFEHFSSRPFLEEILPRLGVEAGARVLELGCGTGPGAVFLARKGFRVQGIDLIPAAIAKARQLAADLGVAVSFEVMDMTQIPPGDMYDLVIDSYASQGIVADEDRVRMFAGVKTRLAHKGYFLSSCCIHDPQRVDPQARVQDEQTGRIFQRFDPDDLWDADVEVSYSLFRPDPHRPSARAQDYDGTIRVGGEWYIPRRRYRTFGSLRDELVSHGFDVIHQGGPLQDSTVAVHSGSGVNLVGPP